MDKDFASFLKLSCERAIKRGNQETAAPERDYSSSANNINDDKVKDELHACKSLLENQLLLKNLRVENF